MKINELLNEQEQLDEIPKFFGGTGGDMPGTAGDTTMGKVGTWIKQKTGMGTGGALLKQARQMGQAMYQQWVGIVPTLQQSGRINAGDPDAYIKYLTYFVQKRLKLTDKKSLDAFKATIGPMPNKGSIIKGFEQAYQSAIIANQAPAPVKKKKPKPPGTP